MSSLFGRISKRLDRPLQHQDVSGRKMQNNYSGSGEKNLQEETSDLINRLESLQKKALELKTLIEKKEEEAQKLQMVIDNKMSKAQELEGFINNGDKNVENIKLAVESQLNKMFVEINVKIDELSKTIRQLKVLDENNNDTSETDKQTQELINDLVENDNKITEKIDNLKSELTEHVHKESVKCYRNVQTLMEEYGAKSTDEDEKSMSKDLKSIKRNTGFAIFFALCNIALLVVHILGII